MKGSPNPAGVSFGLIPDTSLGVSFRRRGGGRRMCRGPEEDQTHSGQRWGERNTATWRDTHTHKERARKAKPRVHTHTCTYAHAHTHTGSITQSFLQKSGHLRSASPLTGFCFCASPGEAPRTRWALPGSPAQQGTSLPSRGSTQLIPELSRGGWRSRDTLWEMRLVGTLAGMGPRQSPGRGGMSGFGSRVSKG